MNWLGLHSGFSHKLPKKLLNDTGQSTSQPPRTLLMTQKSEQNFKDVLQCQAFYAKQLNDQVR